MHFKFNIFLISSKFQGNSTKRNKHASGGVFSAHAQNKRGRRREAQEANNTILETEKKDIFRSTLAENLSSNSNTLQRSDGY